MITKTQSKSNLSHKDLVEMGSKWLINTQKCKVVVKEMKTHALKEVPDIIGWKKRGQSIMIECKISLSDFYHDSNKTSRNNVLKSLGVQKYYLCPKGLIDIKLLPPDWGLLYADGRGITMIKKATLKTSLAERIAKNELPLLIALVQRAQIRGFNVNCKFKDNELV